MEFERFKKRVIKEHKIKSFLIGFSCSLIITALIFIIFKRIPINLHFIIYLFIFIFLELLITFVIYHNFMPSDFKIAKRLDDTFLLKEKVQTMIVYQNNDNQILKAQKDDTESSLKNISSKKLPIKLSVTSILFTILALIIFTSSLIIPTKAAITSSSSSNNSSITSKSDVTSDTSENNTQVESSELGNGSDDNSQGENESLQSESNSNVNSDTLSFNSIESNSSNNSVSGDGETIYAGDDNVFTDEGFKEYGEVIDSFYSNILDTISDGNTDSEISDIILKYFDDLYN